VGSQCYQVGLVSFVEDGGAMFGGFSDDCFKVFNTETLHVVKRSYEQMDDFYLLLGVGNVFFENFEAFGDAVVGQILEATFATCLGSLEVETEGKTWVFHLLLEYFDFLYSIVINIFYLDSGWSMTVVVWLKDDTTTFLLLLVGLVVVIITVVTFILCPFKENLFHEAALFGVVDNNSLVVAQVRFV